MMIFWFLLACAAGYGVYFCWQQFSLASTAADSGLLIAGVLGSGGRIVWGIFGITCAVLCFNFLARSIAASKAQDTAANAASITQEQKAEEQTQQPERKPRTVVRRIKDVHVAGVTFRNEDGESRQGVLRKIEAELPPFDDIVLYDTELGEYEGKPSFAVHAEDVQVGFLPAYLTEDLAPVFEHVELENARVIGGGYNDDGKRISYGMLVDVVVYED